EHRMASERLPGDMIDLAELLTCDHAFGLDRGDARKSSSFDACELTTQSAVAEQRRWRCLISRNELTHRMSLLVSSVSPNPAASDGGPKRVVGPVEVATVLRRGNASRQTTQGTQQRRHRKRR